MNRIQRYWYKFYAAPVGAGTARKKIYVSLANIYSVSLLCSNDDIAFLVSR